MMVKDGWKTSEFWISLFVVVLGAVVASGLLPAETVWFKLAGCIGSVLAAMGYSASRASLKKTASDNAADLAVVSEPPK
jgi:hypothetical protein